MWPSLHPFIIWIGVAADVAKIADSGILLLYFLRSLRIINKMVVCIFQMQRPGVILLKKACHAMCRARGTGGTQARLPVAHCMASSEGPAWPSIKTS